MNTNFSYLVGQKFYTGFDQTEVEVVGAYLDRGEIYTIVVSQGNPIQIVHATSLRKPEKV